MKWLRSSRLTLGAALVLLLAGPAFARQPNHPPALKQNRMEQRAAVRAEQNQNPHLKQWMENHRNLSPAEQQRQLQNEPGFRELPRETQQNELNDLQRLNTMPPEQRDRMLERNEMLERLAPAQRQQYNVAVRSFASMAPDRRRLMSRAVLDLRMMPPEQRQQVIDSPAFAGQFSDGERGTLRTLLSAEPYHPPNQ